MNVSEFAKAVFGEGKDPVALPGITPVKSLDEIRYGSTILVVDNGLRMIWSYRPFLSFRISDSVLGILEGTVETGYFNPVTSSYQPMTKTSVPDHETNPTSITLNGHPDRKAYILSTVP